MNLTQEQITVEFDRQINTLLEKEYPKLLGMQEEEFLLIAETLRSIVEKLEVEPVNLEEGILPFVLVVKSTPDNNVKFVEKIVKDGKSGIEKLFPKKIEDFSPLDSLQIPHSSIYLMYGINRGKEYLNVAPQLAYEDLIKKNLSPLTIDEGVAICTHFPEFLQKNNCFSLLGSRIKDDKRVPAIWINGAKHPNLGWCWNGNLHTWLGSASCKGRVG